MPPVLYLLDGHALAYRAYFAITAGAGNRELKTSYGETTSGVFGFASVVLRLLAQEHPEYLAIAFDAGRTFRNDLYPEYKATRAKMPDDLRTQMDRVRELVDAFGFPRLEVDGVEGDDVLGTIARQAEGKGLAVKIVTGDRDLFQLVGERIAVSLAVPKRKLEDAEDFTPQEVFRTMGVRPDQIVDFKALAGDHSDNIPGVRGVGEKTAVGLLQRFDDLDGVYAHLDELAATLHAKLAEDKDKAYLSRELARIRTDVPIALDVGKAKVADIHADRVESLFRQLEFRSLVDRLTKVTQDYGAAAPPTQLELLGADVARIGVSSQYQIEAHIVDSAEALSALCERLAGARVISLDTETTGLRPMQADLVGMSLAVKEGEGYYIPVGHRTGERQLPWETVREALRPFLMDPLKEKIGHHLKYDGLMLKQNGLDVGPMGYDSMIAEWLIDPETHSLGLKELADSYLGAAMTHIEALIGQKGRGNQQRTMAEVAVTAVAPYAAADAEMVLRLRPLQERRLEERNGLRVLREVEMPLIPVLIDMEYTGVRVDTQFFGQMSQELAQRLEQIQTQIYELVGYEFNLNSTQQLSKVLFDTLHLEPPDRRKRTSSGLYSTSADVLEALRGQHEVVDLILEYRELAKLKSTYLDALPLQVNPRTGRIHTSFNQVGTSTGRLASADPNLQNVPARTPLGQRLRGGFVADAGCALLSVDYSQIELRIVAHVSGDEAMRQAFLAGQDIHTTTAAAIFGVPMDQVSSEMRRRAKAINFGIIYGMSPYGLTQSTGLTLAEAENFIRAYFERFPKVSEYVDETRRLAARQGYVETLLGRRRYFPELRAASNPAVRGRSEREAINAPIQGSAADIIKLAMIRLPEELEKAHLDAPLLLQVHDELVVQTPLDALPETAHVVQEVMENAYPLAVPLKTDTEWGENWGELKPLEEFVARSN
jgi:DNA polymerase-1